MPKRGLPQSIRMRHDEHYVEALNASAGAPLGRLLPIEQLDPNPTQPRQAMGDLSELMASIAEKGIIEPLVVRQRDSRFQIVAGERRYQAAVQLGLREVPVVIREADDHEAIELALVENLQRKDLTPFEEADALQALGQRCGYTHDELARKLGKSRTAITESLALVQRITSRQSTTREDVRRVVAKAKPGRPRAFVFQYRPPTKAFNLKLRFRKPQVEPEELIQALESILAELRSAQTSTR